MAYFFYTLIIYPLYQIIEFVYRVFFTLCGSEGISIIGVSIAVTLLCLPLYAVAEHWQQIERDMQKNMKQGIERIQKTFSGDERYMILSTFYRQHHYHPIMALRSSFGLLIQIPFFIAAYSFLSHNSDLLGKSFFIIKDLGKQDATFFINGFPVNILPLAMTIINIIAGAIYTKGFARKEKIQIYGMALVFLVILYASPAGLVLYWMMNNVFSLIKNIFFKLKNPLKSFWVMMSVVMTLTGIIAAIKLHSTKCIPIVILVLVVVFAPLFLKFVLFLSDTVFSTLEKDKLNRNKLFIFSALGLALLTGIVIPSFLVTSSTAGDFCYIDSYTTPLYFIYNCSLQCFGLFFFWPLCIYFLFNKKTQTCISVLFFIAAVSALINTFCFQGDYGNISPELIFTEHKSFNPSFTIFFLNSAVLLSVICLTVFLFKKHISKIVQGAVSILVIALTSISAINCIKIQSTFKSFTPPILSSASELSPIVHFSKTGRNILVFMLDRAAGYLINDAFEECPEMYDQFTGFTFYPNAVSFGSWTIQGAPGLYGGYEYTPWSMNHRRNITMQEKHNESLSMLPFIFEKAGFRCDVIDPPYPNYDTIPVFSFFDGHDAVHPVEAIGKYSDLWYAENDYKKLPIKSMLIKRNLIWFSIFRIVPPVLRSAVHYNEWWSSPSVVESNSDFINRYSILDFLPELTDVSESENCFVLIDNEATHDTGFCQPPNFVPVESNINFAGVKNEVWRYDRGYHGLVASLKRVGEWFDYLKENEVYDNTRIIIVADHGSNQRSPLIKSEGDLPRNIEWFNPMLMVKDFNAQGKFVTNTAFMTQADTPALALNGVIENPINPFTGKEIKTLSEKEKLEEIKISFSKANAVRSNVNNGLKIADDDWYTVHGDIYDVANWKHLYVVNGELKER